MKIQQAFFSSQLKIDPGQSDRSSSSNGSAAVVRDLRYAIKKQMFLVP